MDAHDHLALLIAVIAQNGPTPLHPDDIHAAQGRVLTMWEADGAVWLRVDDKPADTSSQAATSRPDVVELSHRLARKQGGPSDRRKTVPGPDDHPAKDVTA